MVVLMLYTVTGDKPPGACFVPDHIYHDLGKKQIGN